MKDDKDKLRTNPSETDLCLQEEVQEITVHKKERQLKSIIKVATDHNMFTTGEKQLPVPIWADQQLQTEP